ncbi:hypothetical protein AB0E62_34140 [Streptomyces sp. NPDC038707]|uniref:hypothetical protein n=1 Tax=Streptomyces sp. NPDC038707 TaxID=3154329 RepID=UPI0033F2CA68
MAMHIRISDGTVDVEVEARGYSRRRLAATEAAARRLLDALRREQPADEGAAFGFAAGRSLDGVSLDSDTERAEPYVDDRGEDDEDDQA